MSKSFFSDPLAMIFDAKMLKESIATVGGGALGGATFMGIVGLVQTMRPVKDADGKEVKDAEGKVLKQKGYFFDTRWKRGLLAVGLGCAGGRALWNQQRELSKGLMGSMGGALGSEFVGYLLQLRREAAMKAGTTEKPYTGVQTPAVTLGNGDRSAEAALEAILAGKDGTAALPEEMVLRGLGAAAETIEYQKRQPGEREVLSGPAIEVEEAGPALSTWLGGY